MQNIEENLKKLNVVLPEPASPVATYVPYNIVDNLLFISGQGPFDGSKLITGKVGDELSIEDGQEAARLCALMILSQAKRACGNLNNIKKCIKLGGFVNSGKDFADHALILDGASKILIQILGKSGWHARFAVGSSSLPLNMAVEIDAIFEIKN